jgi:hypothetical protein
MRIGGGSGEDLPKINWESTAVVKKSQPSSSEPAVAPGKTVAVKNGARLTGKGSADRPDLTLDVIERAQDSKKPVLLFFTAGNRDALTMENLVLGQKGIVEFAKNFHAVKVDLQKMDRAILNRYQVKAAPAVVFLDSRGNLLQTLAGRTTPTLLQKAMKSALEKSQAGLKIAKKRTGPLARKD